jgi:hypothetical protein
VSIFGQQSQLDLVRPATCQEELSITFTVTDLSHCYLHAGICIRIALVAIVAIIAIVGHHYKSDRNAHLGTGECVDEGRLAKGIHFISGECAQANFSDALRPNWLVQD